MKALTRRNSEFLAMLRATSIGIIVFGHVGGFWFFKPYSEFLHVFLPVFFFISGALSYYSYKRSPSPLNYYVKRVLQLLIPYYLLCVLSLIVYLCQHHTFPKIVLNELILWLTVNPPNQLTPFPIGQVWFLHTLIIITLLSPIYFLLYSYKPSILFIFCILVLCIAGVQTTITGSDIFGMHTNDNIYKPLVHSIFYILGIVYFQSQYMDNKASLLIVAIISLAMSIGLVYVCNLNIDYEFHTYRPDLYYVSGCIFAISLLLLAKNVFVAIIGKIHLAGLVLAYMHKHTFSIFVLHSLAIYLSETLLGLSNPEYKTISYGLIKLMCVVALTALMSPPFTWLSTLITKNMLALFGLNASSFSLYAARQPTPQLNHNETH